MGCRLSRWPALRARRFRSGRPTAASSRFSQAENSRRSTPWAARQRRSATRRAAGAAAWSPDGTIVFTGSPNSPISRIAAAGGAVRPATTFNRDQSATAHNWPQFLPDGRHYLFYQISLKPEHQGIYVASLDSAETTRVARQHRRRQVRFRLPPVRARRHLVRAGVRRSGVPDTRRSRRASPIASATSARRLAMPPSPCHRRGCSPMGQAWR